MCSLFKNIVINTSAEQVWRVLSNPKHLPNLNPSVSEFTFTAYPTGGFEGNWVYALDKLKLRSKLRTGLFQPQQQMIVESCGQMKSKWSWYLESDGVWTHLALSVDYTAHWSSVGAVLHDSVLEHQHKEVLGLYMHNIKRAAEKVHS